jgi:hypothetical protein
MRCVALGALSSLAAASLSAQDIVFLPRLQPEVRLETISTRHASVLAMAGANVPWGYYIRTGVAVGAGAVAAGGVTRLAQRADLTMRFLLDPFAETPWGPYAGGGFTVRRDGSERAAAGLLLVLGVEGRRGRRWTPSAELGLGEGVRIAVVLRKARTNGR